MKTASQALGEKSGDLAITGAFDYLKSKGKFTLEILDKLADPLKRHSSAALPKALADAKEALDCGMSEHASLTFALTMRQSGIDAAKEILGE